MTPDPKDTMFSGWYEFICCELQVLQWLQMEKSKKRDVGRKSNSHTVSTDIEMRKTASSNA
jgi:hypothetical protein